ncbi:phosphoribosylamine--glycine ligase [Granulosicoccus antarcticus]|uniref:Phosphoribosylamine--glycine ligase n=1 Tax=Granulosicoccus antarcticus IMCC3135 TaxID=1192854 RepID=A0A2Z2NP96_9GAMM|nr:phosphoribosylamine--glycine ligase [Granulosicoccus antarcticus]ASJ71488.1 Phosphoribosylamine--glycine ligase [Granulosicoccus antarcticus IMCC3135]
MHLLLIGSGGREHAMAWKLAQTPGVTRVSIAPGNPGMLHEDKLTPVAIEATDIESLLDFARNESVHLTIVGPEAPLVAGIVDTFTAQGLRIFGPQKSAAQLEGSKSFAKDFMARNNIPTASYATFSEVAPALEYIHEQGAPIVIKADGLAAGKGVVVAQTEAEACAAVESMLAGQFGEAGAQVVIEGFLAGEEASFIAVVSGRDAMALASSQDHKARDEGDLGPNTGGMGAYSPAPVVTDSVHQHVMRDIVQPTIDALVDEGMPFTGFLYVGLMIDEKNQARVVEYNVRLGDPETQPLMMRLQSDLLALLDHAVDGTLPDAQINWHAGSAIGIVMAAGEYPAGSSQGKPITGIEEAESNGECKVFQAGTRLEADQLVTAGGRVLCVTSAADSLAKAKAQAEAGASSISWDGCRYRRDIGHRAL